MDGNASLAQLNSPSTALTRAIRQRYFQSPNGVMMNGASSPGLSLRAMFEAGEASAHDFADEVALEFQLPRVSLAEMMAAQTPKAGLSERFLREASVFPFVDSEGAAQLAMADPSDEEARRAAAIALEMSPEIVVASFEDIASALAARFGEATVKEAASVRGPVEEESLDHLRDLASGAPVVRAFDAIVEKAANLRASDIHIEPGRMGLSVRMRVDGVLRAVAAPADAPPAALISRLKILSGLNIAERRLPQDGALRMKIGRNDIDMRVATLPTPYGESAVIRLLPRDRGLLDIAKLGLREPDEKRVRRALNYPNGMIIVSGPTGSGKTTTLATLLMVLNTPAVKILTIEDPIEYELSGVVQTQVKTSVGFTFASAMRAFLRHNPNIIMVGEVRDKETADTAVNAALTGHLVLTTLHTETAAGALPRLIDLGVEPFLLKSTLRLLVAQRLVRVLCDRCKVRRPLTADDLNRDPRLALLNLSAGETVCEPKGCERCGGIGFRGRVGVFEAIDVEGEAREQVRAGADSHALESAAIRAGMTTMTVDAADKVRTGVTSISEALRVTAIR